MTAPLRQPMDSFVGTIRPCFSTSQVMTSDVFATLPTLLGPGWYVPAQVVDDATGKREAVRIIGTNGTTTATVMRGVEGTTALDWDQATIRCTPAVYDATMVFAAPGLVPTDLHVGARYIDATEALVREQTYRQGALPTVRGAPADMPRSLAGAGAHYRSLGMRVKALAFGPIITSSYGSCGVYWDGAGSPGSMDTMLATEGPRLGFVALALAMGYLLGSSNAWAGHIAVNSVFGPPWGVQMLCKKPDGTALANQQVGGSVLIIGG